MPRTKHTVFVFTDNMELISKSGNKVTLVQGGTDQFYLQHHGGTRDGYSIPPILGSQLFTAEELRTMGLKKR